MLYSMTGFGKGECHFGNGNTLQVEISSLNRKQLEIRFSMPGELNEFEVIGRKTVGRFISRGTVLVRVTVCNAGGSSNYKVDSNLLDSLVRECRAARVRAGLNAEVALETLLLAPGVMSAGHIDSADPELKAAFCTALERAGENFQQMRAAEGKLLKEDLEERLVRLEEMHSELERFTSGQPEAAKRRLLARFETEKFPISPDDPSLLKEVLFYIDKGDVSEELTRLSSHFIQFHKFLESDQPAGRSLDFLAQEIFREITTLSNKAFATGVSRLVVSFKAEMEKVREQLQNIE